MHMHMNLVEKFDLKYVADNFCSKSGLQEKQIPHIIEPFIILLYILNIFPPKILAMYT